ncbi:MAG: family 43 glycosylhydrolase [Bacteroidaceae bacterium]|nr:family 43 glycosylhydrolase [Bacteroidaceae bacterium]
MKHLITIVLSCSLAQTLSAQNPYLPLWEHIPDGEPYVFEDPDRPGRYRVYLYGSHDDLINTYCGYNQVVWSAPVEEPTAWRYDGVCFTSVSDANGNPLNPGGQGDLLYAPDIVEAVENGHKVYYFIPNNQHGARNTMVAKADRPDGPFTVCNWAPDGSATYGCLHFDPAVMIDDDGRAYGYWGFKRSYAAELDPRTMCTVKPGAQIIEDMVPGYEQDREFRFFEASSIRKVMGKYVFIYSRFTNDGEFGLHISNNTLAYAYSDHPLGPWTYGGTIIDGRSRGKDAGGNAIATGYCTGNTHGSICEVNGRWWVFYHRHTGTTEFARQPMVAPIDITLTPDGRLLITEGEVTSEGFRTEGLNPLERTPAGLACHFTGPRPMTADFPNFFPTGSYPKATHNHNDILQTTFSQNYPHSHITNNTAGSIIGYKYFNFTHLADALTDNKQAAISLHLKPLGVTGDIVIMLDSPYESDGGKTIATLHLTGSEAQTPQHLSTPLTPMSAVNGKHPLYILFRSATPDTSLCDLYSLIFTATK